MATTPGRVINRAALELPRDAYDFAVIGGGLLGVVCAWFLRQFAPERSVLLIEAGGIPSEAGATHVAPALHHHFFPDAEHAARTRWLSAWLRSLEGKQRLFSRVGFLQRAADAPGDVAMQPLPFAEWRESQPANVRWNVDALFGFADAEAVAFDPAGGYGHAEALVLQLGQAAVGCGLDLMLNARAAFDGPDVLQLDRLEANNRMQVETVRQTQVRARTVVVACGAEGARLIDAGLGARSPFAPRCFLQYPRFENDRQLRRDPSGNAALPVVAAHGFAIRPHGDGALLVPLSALPPDAADYVPSGGGFLGVTVGLRRELLHRLLPALDVLPALSRPSLNLGKTPGNLRGAWEALTPSGRPEFWRVPDTDVWQLASGGGPQAFALGIAQACDLAHRLSRTNHPLPWRK